MEKSIRKLISSLSQGDDGKLNGGFGHIRGGANLDTLMKVSNDGPVTCTTNPQFCQGQNTNCNNQGACDGSGNSHCSNTGVCFA